MKQLCLLNERVMKQRKNMDYVCLKNDMKNTVMLIIERKYDWKNIYNFCLCI